MFGYLTWLVDTGIFTKIHLGFLPVGCVSVRGWVGWQLHSWLAPNHRLRQHIDFPRFPMCLQ